jgi:hypothetical protein
MYTYQDFEKKMSEGIESALTEAITQHMKSDIYLTAKSADEYDHQRNETITNYVKTIFTLTGTPVEDFTASNNKLCSNFFHRLNTQRCTYLLGNGVQFTDHKRIVKDQNGMQTTIDETKEFFGDRFDIDLKKAGYNALIHGVTFGFWNKDRLYIFPITEFVPLWDEDNGVLRAGIRFWRIDKNKPTVAVLYERDGYTKYKSKAQVGFDFEEIQAKRAYMQVVSRTEVGGDEAIEEENYSDLPIIPMWGSHLKQSTLIGMKEKIDSFDLIRSGFANDLTDCAQVYWILENCMGMNPTELEKFRSRLKFNHIAVADTDNSKVTPYTQEIPYQARKEYLDEIRSGIYEDFGALDVHTVAAGATNDHIDAAYQPMDEEADDFEYQVNEFLQGILGIVGIEDNPTFKRNRISNQKEQTETILLASDYLDDETVLSKLPFISVDEVANVLARRDEESQSRFEQNEEPEEEEEVTVIE